MANENALNAALRPGSVTRQTVSRANFNTDAWEWETPSGSPEMRLKSPWELRLKENLIVEGTTNLTLASYADNAAAVTGGLSVGDLYRIAGADTVGVVHA